MVKSGVMDKNGVDISNGDFVKITIQHQIGPPTVSVRLVEYRRGAFRFIDESGKELSCIGDLSYRCEVEIVNA